MIVFAAQQPRDASASAHVHIERLALQVTGTPPAAPTSVASPTPQADGRIVYQVAEGDTLSAIAVRFGLTLDELFAMNDLNEDAVISVGQEILLGVSDEAAGREGEGETLPPGVEGGSDDTLVYQVAAGDTLLGIALQYDLELGELLALNPGLTEDSLLQLGQEIVVSERRQPASVGGSTDLPEGMGTAPITVTSALTNPTPTLPQPFTPTPLPATPTQALAVLEVTATAGLEGTAPEEQAAEPPALPANIGQRRIPTWLVAVGAFVFVTGLSGAILFYLGSRQPRS